jgi:hypothetical protein
MNFRPDIEILENEFGVLNQQVALTSENWTDLVQIRFYEQFINTIPKEAIAFMNSLEELSLSFENAERNIIELQNRL